MSVIVPIGKVLRAIEMGGKASAFAKINVSKLKELMTYVEEQPLVKDVESKSAKKNRKRRAAKLNGDGKESEKGVVKSKGSTSDGSTGGTGAAKAAMPAALTKAAEKTESKEGSKRKAVRTVFLSDEEESESSPAKKSKKSKTSSDTEIVVVADEEMVDETKVDTVVKDKKVKKVRKVKKPNVVDDTVAEKRVTVEKGDKAAKVDMRPKAGGKAQPVCRKGKMPRHTSTPHRGRNHNNRPHR